MSTLGLCSSVGELRSSSVKTEVPAAGECEDDAPLAGETGSESSGMASV